ncbi:MAG: hypothetical protein QOE16_411, partial [Microbacteriaceae bacterium]|nr:hypothetical protein [Microbacteriaceae bacterium]
MDWFQADDYELARQVLQRGTAAIYLIAFLSAVAQFPALLGEHGLLPAPRFLTTTYARRQPTLFRWRYSDRLLRLVAWLGAASAASIVAGIPQLGPSWVPAVLFLAIWFAYLSIVNVGQIFYGFGWETLLLEAGFLAIFLGNAEVAPPLPVILGFRWLAFRVEFGAGLIKLRGDPCWRDLTCMEFHHETQPMPNPLSWFFHHLPRPIHRLEALGNFIAQLVLPFGLFLPQPFASGAAVLMILTQLYLVVSVYYDWLNWVSIVAMTAALADPVVRVLLPFGPTVFGP